MTIGIECILQVKIPVSDLRRSVAWYTRVFDLRLAWEFVEEGVVRGAVLTDQHERFLIGLRDRAVIPSRPEFPGFDLFSFGVGSVAVLEDLARRFDDLDVEHGPLIDRGAGGGVQLDVPDPDGTVIRFLSPFGEHPPFAGVEFHADGPPSFYDTSRLTV
ncbi:VOC family protein [Catellatospora sichuanensis]|uniref:VOC family protein n=1 Tax=Catellatospora sichuanensis TaxID=1969805 RepID=UPI0011840AB1|nr:VOC family protein [Catellatospora sichuanensis]